MSVRDMNLDDLATFQQIVDSGGLTAAARVLKRSTKQVSRQLQRLEDAVGAPLLNRTTRSVSITDAGRHLYAHASRILDEVALAARSVGPSDDPVQGTVRVALPTLWVTAGLSRVLTDLTRRTRLALQVSVRDGPLDLVGGGFDLHLTAVRPSQTTLVVRRLGVWTGQLAAHRAYLDQAPPLARPEDLANHECLRYLSDTVQDDWTLVHRDGRSLTVPVGGRFQSDNSALLLDVLRAGMGVGPVVAGQLEAGPGLTRVLPEWTFEPLPIYAVLTTSARRRASVEVVLDAVATGMEGWLR